MLRSSVVNSHFLFPIVMGLINTMGATIGAGTAHPSEAPVFTPGF